MKIRRQTLKGSTALIGIGRRPDSLPQLAPQLAAGFFRKTIVNEKVRQ